MIRTRASIKAIEDFKRILMGDIQRVIVKRKLSYDKLQRDYGIAYTTASRLRNPPLDTYKLSFSFERLFIIASLLGCNVNIELEMVDADPGPNTVNTLYTTRLLGPDKA